jgi:pimeloyl-ACP methyl ester carboxylesterase
VDLTAAVTGGLVPVRTRAAGEGLQLGCLLWGDGDAPTVLLVHGNGGHAHWWDPLIPALVPGWRVVAPDLRGHGESEWPEPPGYHLRDFAADLDALVRALAPGPLALVGHSMGGRVAVWYAAEHPERVSHLALVDTRLGPVPPGAAAAFRSSIQGKRTGRGYPTRAAAMAAFRFIPDEPDVPPAVVADLAHHAVVERGPGDWTFRFDRAVLSLDGDGGGDLIPALRRVRCPVALMAGRESWVMGEDERARLVAAAPQATVEVFPGGHHFLVAQAGPVGAALRAFLDG